MNRRTFLLSALAITLPISLSPDWEIVGHVHDTVIKEATRDLAYFPKGTRIAFKLKD